MNQAINPAILTTDIETVFLDRLLRSLQDGTLILPSLPEIAMAIQDLIKQENSSLEQLCKLINQDAAITARLMQVSNSPLFRVGAPINSVDAAIKRLGRDVIQNIVIGMATEQLFHASHHLTHRKLQQCWQHSMEVSSLTAGYSQQFPHMKTDLAMLSGLLHDIGALPILTLAEQYPLLLENEALLDTLIDRAHVEIGTAILQKWDFPEPVVEAIRHHDDLEYTSGAKATYTDLVIVANLLSSQNMDKFSGTLVNNVPAFAQLGMEDMVMQQLGMSNQSAVEPLFVL